MAHLSSHNSSKLIAVHWDDQSRSAEDIIRHLASENDLAATVTVGDKLADDMARLDGDDVVLDEVEQLLINLDKLGFYVWVDLTRLHARYLRERRA